MNDQFNATSGPASEPTTQSRASTEPAGVPLPAGNPPLFPLEEEEETAATSESTGMGRALAAVLLIGLVLLPIGAIAVGAAWLWNSNSTNAAGLSLGAVVTEVPAPAAADRLRVAQGDQGIEFSGAVRGDVFPLKEMSTGKPITEEGEPLYVTREGNRVAFPVLFQDDFANPGSGWEGGLAGGYAQGEYRVLTAGAGADSALARHARQFGDLTLRLDGRLDRPTQGMYLLVGIRFRPVGQGGEGYVWVITPDDRSFRLELWQQEGGTTRRTPLIRDTVASAIEPSTAWNRLVARAVGTDIMLLVNGQVVGTTRDETFNSGGLALGVGKRADASSFANGDARYASLVVSATN